MDFGWKINRHRMGGSMKSAHPSVLAMLFLSCLHAMATIDNVQNNTSVTQTLTDLADLSAL